MYDSVSVPVPSFFAYDGQIRLTWSYSNLLFPLFTSMMWSVLSIRNLCTAGKQEQENEVSREAKKVHVRACERENMAMPPHTTEPENPVKRQENEALFPSLSSAVTLNADGSRFF